MMHPSCRYFAPMAGIATMLLAVLVLKNDVTPDHLHAELPEHLRPFRPMGIRILNTVGGYIDRRGWLALGTLDPDQILGEACSELAKSKTKDDATTTKPCALLDKTHRFNDDRWDTSFRKLMDALSGANLSFLGKLVSKGHVLGWLATRGRLLEAFQQDGEPAPKRLRDPVFVVGLPRTGTTLLSRLLALDPANRAPTMWEYMDPVPRPPHPPPVNATSGEWNAYGELTDDRIAVQRGLLDQYRALAPGLDDLHPMDATFPEECIIIMNMAMDSEQAMVTYPVYEYMQWLLEMDHHRDVLQWNKRVVEHLQENDPYGPRRWVLKTPYYLAMMDDIRTIHPNAKIVHTHRNPTESIPSVASVIAKTHSIVTDDIDLTRMGAQQAELHETMLAKALAVRAGWKAEESTNDPANTDDHDDKDDFRVVDVHLQDLQKDPVATVEHIYRTLFNTPLDPVHAKAMTQWLEKNPRKPHGLKRPTPADFGLEEYLRKSEVFSEYQRAFGTKKAAAYDSNSGNSDDGNNDDNAPTTEL